MNRRSIALVVPLAAALMLGACTGGTSPAATSGPGAPGNQPASATPPPTAGTPADTAAPSAPPAATGPVDACALLTSEEVATLVPGAAPVANADEAGPIPTYSCTWDAAISNGMIPASLTVIVQPGFVSGSGADPDFVKTMLEAEGKNADNGGRVVEGLGDVGIVTSVVKFDAEAKFLDGDTLVQVDLTREDAPSKQDAVVELARAVAGRLP